MNKADLLKKFLSNSCNEEEARIVMQYLKAEPWLLDEMLTKAEWDEIDTSLPMIPVVEMEMRKNISVKTIRSKFSIAKSVLSAAAVLSALTFALIVLYNYNRTLPVEKHVATNRQSSKTTEKIENNTNENKEITLDDYSTVSLFPGSSVEFNIDFIKKRSIKLNGKAIFTVVKNEESPFIVYSGAISTTALGTRFLVDNRDDVSKINVKLFEGRVVVQPADNILFIEETYLEAGQQCFVDINARLVKIKLLYEPKLVVQKKYTPANRKNISSIKKADRLNFSKTPISEVLETLQEVYNKTIQFDREDIHERYFTGSFSDRDSLSTILRMISVMNGLKFNTEGEKITVIKVGSENTQPNIDDKPDNLADSVYQIGPIENIKPDKIAPQPESLSEMQAIPYTHEKIVVSKKEIRFTGISFSELIQQLQTQTKRKIYFNSEDLDKINFTGSIPFDDSIRNTLYMICRSNGLTLIVKKGSYYINKAEN